MTIFSLSTRETAAALTLLAATTAGVIWFFARKRPTAEELERERRRFLGLSGRLVDGMLLDVREMEAEDGRTLTVLCYNYRVGGVEYECSQDITTLRQAAAPAELRPGFPCSVRYLSGSPQNSVVVSEEWSGLRIDPPGRSSSGAFPAQKHDHPA